jgi:hypothetical protein
LAKQIYQVKLDELKKKEEELQARIASGTQEPELASV